jgi:hypothetical protein
MNCADCGGPLESDDAHITCFEPLTYVHAVGSVCIAALKAQLAAAREDRRVIADGLLVKLRTAESDLAAAREALEEAKRYPAQCTWESYDGETGDFKGICGNARPCPKHDRAVLAGEGPVNCNDCGKSLAVDERALALGVPYRHEPRDCITALKAKNLELCRVATDARTLYAAAERDLAAARERYGHQGVSEP